MQNHPRTGEPVNILLVDDQPAKLLSYEAILDELGETLLKASSAAKALEFLLRTEVAVVLVDVCMPDLDGFQLASMIRAHPRFEKTAIIFVSAVQVADLDLVRGYEHGAVDYVAVPVVPEILRAKVAVFLDLYRKTRELEHLNDELEERVAERTAALEMSMSRLHRSEEELQQAARRKDEFLATLSHELRNPLAPILAATQLLGVGKLSPERRDHARQVIERQVGQLVRLVDDLLDVSRITNDKIALQRERVSIGDVVARAVETTLPLLESKELQLDIAGTTSDADVLGDLARLVQVLGNLLNNAAKYTQHGGRVEIRAAREDGSVVVTVADTGSGIPKEMLPRVFDLFTQAGKEELGRGGLGIGLALVRRLVEMHGGTVEAMSDGIGLGSSFTVRLPALEQAGSDDAPETAPEKSGVRHTGHRVLIADDNQDAAESLAELCTHFGHTVRVAHDGLDAVELAAAFLPRVILLDIGMPGLDGYEAARRIRREPWGKDMVLIAQTGWGQEEDRHRAESAGFDRHLTKPIGLEQLERVLSAVPAGRRESSG